MAQWQPRPQWQPPVGVGADDDNPLYDVPFVGGVARAVSEAPRRFTETREDRETRERMEDAQAAQRLQQQQGVSQSQALAQVQTTRRFRPDPLRWVQERAEDTRENPVLGGLRSAVAPFEAAGTALRYGTGLALAGEQAFLEQNRVHLPGVGLVGGGPAAGIDPWAGTAFAGGPPVPALRNPLDPTEALQRTQAMAGPASTLLDLASGAPIGGAMAAGARTLGRAGALGALPDLAETGPVAGGILRPLTAPGTGVLGATVPPAIGAVAGAVHPLGVPEGEEPTTVDRLLGATEGALGGMLLGALASPLERRLLPPPSATPWRTELPAGHTLTGDQVSRLQTIQDNIATGEGRTSAARYPGGAVWHAVDRALYQFIDDLAPVWRVVGLFDKLDQPRYEARVGAVGATLAQAEREAANPALAFSNSRMNTLGVHAVDAVRSDIARAGGLRDDEIGYLQQRNTLRGYQTAANPRPTPGNPEPEPTFFGPYRQVATAQGPDAARAFLDSDLRSLDDTIGKAFPGRPNTVQRMEEALQAHGRQNNIALRRLEDTGWLKPGLAAELVGRYGEQHAVLEDVTRWHDTMVNRGGPQVGKGYVGGSPHVGSFHEAEDLPVWTVRGAEQKILNAHAVADKNAGARLLADMLDREGPIPGVLEYNGRSTQAIPGGLATTWNEDVPKGMKRIPFSVGGEYMEMLGEGMFADALTGATLQKHNAFTNMLRVIHAPFRLGVTALSPFFAAVHSIRQMQELVEKVPRGQFLETMGAAYGAFYGEFTAPFAGFAREHPAHPLVAGLPGTIARALDRIAPVDSDWARGIVQEFRREGGGGAGLLGSTPAAHIGAGGPWYTRPIATVNEAAHALIQMGDEAPRAAQFHADLQRLLRAGVPRETALPGALQRAQTFTNDYSRSGASMRLLNQFMPLLNARKEGALTSIGGAIEDPQKFATRMTALVGFPLVAAYTANRLFYGSAYDDIPIEEKDLYFHIPHGWWTDEQGQNHPATIKIIKSPFLQVFTAPLEHLLDAQYHLMQDGEYLSENQRTPRPTSRMWAAQALRMTAFEGEVDSFADVRHFVMSGMGLFPTGTMAVEMISGEDHFTGRPLIPPEKRILPPEYQYGIGTSWAAKALGKVTHVSPTTYDLIAQDLFGTAGRAAMHAPDAVVGVLQRNNLIPPGDMFAPHSVADLPSLKDVPPELAYRYLDQLQHEDQRPWYAGFLSRFLGSAYSGRSVAQRARELGPEQFERWQATQEYHGRQQEIRLAHQREAAELEQKAGGLTAEQYRQRQADLIQRERGAFQQLANDYTGKAWTTPAEVEAARQAMPGVDVERFKNHLATLPPGADPHALLEQYKAIEHTNPEVKGHLQNQWLHQQSQALHVDTGTLLDYLGAEAMGRELAGVPVPATEIEFLRTQHAAPSDPKTPGGPPLDRMTTPPDQFRAAQRAVISRYAQAWGVPEADLQERLNARYHLPETVGVTQATMQRAQAVETRFHNPSEFPRFADAHGAAVGTEADWPIWDAQLDAAKQRYGTNVRRWPPGLRQVDSARRYGEAHRYGAMLEQAGTPEGAANLMAWEEFYGTGRNATLDQFARFQSGELPKYRTPRGQEPITPARALEWDAMYRMYQLLPEGPDKRRYRVAAQRIHRLAIPAWQRVLDPTGEVRQSFAAPSEEPTEF